MTDFLLAAAGFVLAMVALGLVRVLRGPGDADRMMAAQLLGSGGIAALLLGGAAIEFVGFRQHAVDGQIGSFGPIEHIAVKIFQRVANIHQQDNALQALTLAKVTAQQLFNLSLYSLRYLGVTIAG